MLTRGQKRFGTKVASAASPHSVAYGPVAWGLRHRAPEGPEAGRKACIRSQGLCALLGDCPGALSRGSELDIPNSQILNGACDCPWVVHEMPAWVMESVRGGSGRRVC